MELGGETGPIVTKKSVSEVVNYGTIVGIELELDHPSFF